MTSETVAYMRSDTPAEACAKGRAVGSWGIPDHPPRTYGRAQTRAWRWGWADARTVCLRAGGQGGRDVIAAGDAQVLFDPDYDRPARRRSTSTAPGV